MSYVLEDMSNDSFCGNPLIRLATVYGDNFIFIKEPFKPQVDLSKSSYILLDPTYYGGYSIEIQGEVSSEEIMKVAQSIGLSEVKQLLSTKGTVDAWFVF